MFSTNSGFASFSTNDLPATWHFYKEVLKLQVHASGDNLNVTFPNGTHVLIYGKDDHVPASHTVLNIMVDDVPAAAAQLREAGIELEALPWTDEDHISRGSGHGMPTIAWFKDPGGNWVSIIEITDKDLT
jgi:catechol 2,3-dioxygenase-like lactoylglutathione lyase family enzyme